MIRYLLFAALFFLFSLNHLPARTHDSYTEIFIAMVEVLSADEDSRKEFVQGTDEKRRDVLYVSLQEEENRVAKLSSIYQKLYEKRTAHAGRFLSLLKAKDKILLLKTIWKTDNSDCKAYILKRCSFDRDTSSDEFVRKCVIAGMDSVDDKLQRSSVECSMRLDVNRREILDKLLRLADNVVDPKLTASLIGALSVHGYSKKARDFVLDFIDADSFEGMVALNKGGNLASIDYMKKINRILKDKKDRRYKTALEISLKWGLRSGLEAFFENREMQRNRGIVSALAKGRGAGWKDDRVWKYLQENPRQLRNYLVKVSFEDRGALTLQQLIANVASEDKFLSAIASMKLRHLLWYIEVPGLAESIASASGSDAKGSLMIAFARRNDFPGTARVIRENYKNSNISARELESILQALILCGCKEPGKFGFDFKRIAELPDDNWRKTVYIGWLGKKKFSWKDVCRNIKNKKHFVPSDIGVLVKAVKETPDELCMLIANNVELLPKTRFAAAMRLFYNGRKKVVNRLLESSDFRLKSLLVREFFMYHDGDIFDRTEKMIKKWCSSDVQEERMFAFQTICRHFRDVKMIEKYLGSSGIQQTHLLSNYLFLSI